jgi:hypothetical protein
MVGGEIIPRSRGIQRLKTAQAQSRSVAQHDSSSSTRATSTSFASHSSKTHSIGRWATSSVSPRRSHTKRPLDQLQELPGRDRNSDDDGKRGRPRHRRPPRSNDDDDDDDDDDANNNDDDDDDDHPAADDNATGDDNTSANVNSLRSRTRRVRNLGSPTTREFATQPCEHKSDDDS